MLKMKMNMMSAQILNCTRPMKQGSTNKQTSETEFPSMQSRSIGYETKELSGPINMNFDI